MYYDASQSMNNTYHHHYDTHQHHDTHQHYTSQPVTCLTQYNIYNNFEYSSLTIPPSPGPGYQAAPFNFPQPAYSAPLKTPSISQQPRVLDNIPHQAQPRVPDHIPHQAQPRVPDHIPHQAQLNTPPSIPYHPYLHRGTSSPVSDYDFQTTSPEKTKETAPTSASDLPSNHPPTTSEVPTVSAAATTRIKTEPTDNSYEMRYGHDVTATETENKTSLIFPEGIVLGATETVSGAGVPLQNASSPLTSQTTQYHQGGENINQGLK